MRRILALLAVSTVVAALTACGGGGETDDGLSLEGLKGPVARDAATVISPPPALPTSAIASPPSGAPPTVAAPAATLAAPTATPTLGPNDLVYTVARGDTLFGLALRYGVSAEDLARRNAIADINVLEVGRTLVIPGGKLVPTLTPTPVVPTATPAPPTATPAPTNTPLPPTATPLPPTATPVPPAYPFAHRATYAYQNCSMLGVWGYVLDSDGWGVPGYHPALLNGDGGFIGEWWDQETRSVPEERPGDPWAPPMEQGGGPSDLSHDGLFEINWSPGETMSGDWLLYIVDGAGNRVSDYVGLTTDACGEGDRQTFWVYFEKVG